MRRAVCVLVMLAFVPLAPVFASSDRHCVVGTEYATEVYLGVLGGEAAHHAEVFDLIADASALFRDAGVDGPQWATDDECRPHVVELPLGGVAWSDVSAALRPHVQADVRANVRRLVFVPAAGAACGLAVVPGVEGAPTSGDVTAIVYRPCGWTAPIVAHEILHTLGAVHPGSPAADGAWHCRPEWGRDVMCQRSGDVCPPRTLDCQGDSYFAVEPRAGGWLEAHPDWNAARSPFLRRQEPGPPEPEPPAPPVSGFSDAAFHEHRDAIERLSELDVLLGYPDGTFRPNAPVTRGQAAAMLDRLLDVLEGGDAR